MIWRVGTFDHGVHYVEAGEDDRREVGRIVAAKLGRKRMPAGSSYRRVTDPAEVEMAKAAMAGYGIEA